MGKGNGKSELAGAIAVLECAGPFAPPSPDVIVVAASLDQAGIIFDAIKAMIGSGPLARYFDLFDAEIVRKDGPGRIRRIAANFSTADGLRPTAALYDEVHEFTTPQTARTHLVVSNGLVKRADAVEINITTAGAGLNSLLGSLYQAGLDDDDPSFLFRWYAASEKHDLDTDDGLRAALREANPAIAAGFLSEDRLVARFREVPRHEFERYYLNRWVSSPEHWISPEDWARCARPGYVPPDGSEIVLGFDGSVRRDCTALVGCTVDGPTRHLFAIRTWEPKGEPVPRLEVEAEIAKAMNRWKVRELACDPNGWREDVERWAVEYGEERVLAYEMYVARTAPACDALRGAVQAAVEGITPLPLTHDGDAVLARHVANARTSATRFGEHIRKETKDSPNRIDAAMAAVIAFDRAGSAQPSVEPWFGSGSNVYTAAGLVARPS